MTNGTSSPSVSGITAQIELEGAGPPPRPLSPPSATTFEIYVPEPDPAVDRSHRLWWLWVSIRHRLGIHTMVPIENWDYRTSPPTVTYEGKLCWLCPRRTR